jgi:hypothetical protein
MHLACAGSVRQLRVQRSCLQGVLRAAGRHASTSGAACATKAALVQHGTVPLDLFDACANTCTLQDTYQTFLTVLPHPPQG